MPATLRIGIADGQLAIQVDGKEIIMDLDQSLELFNAIGEVLERMSQRVRRPSCWRAPLPRRARPERWRRGASTGLG